MPSGSSITIVVPTHDRPEKLLSLLESIQKYYVSKIESVVVVDDSRQPVDLTGRFSLLNIDHVIFQHRIFISKAKNVGWRRAKTEFVFFIDDDNVVGSDTISKALSGFSRKEKIGAIMPAVLYKSMPAMVWVYATPFGNSPPKFILLGRNLRRNPSWENKFYSTDALPNASLVKRRALEEVGGFNEQLIINSSMDLALRLKRKGWRVLADTGCFIYHDVEPPGKMGWWATHGAADPQRVRYEIRDWFIIMRMIRQKQRLLVLRSIFQSFRFVLPNSLAYALRGKSRIELFSGLARGYVEGILESGHG